LIEGDCHSVFLNFYFPILFVEPRQNRK